jgi:hypothetical protein
MAGRVSWRPYGRSIQAQGVEPIWVYCWPEAEVSGIAPFSSGYRDTFTVSFGRVRRVFMTLN